MLNRNIEIKINGKSHSVEVEQMESVGNNRFRVSWDDVTREVDARYLTRDTLSLIFMNSGWESYSVRCIETGYSGELEVHVGGGVFRALVDRDSTKFMSRTGDTSDGDGELQVTAPMSGKVVRLLVQPGQDVVIRQGLVVVEAMKMENELRSVRAGRVKEVFVEEGMSVETGQVLIVIA